MKRIGKMKEHQVKHILRTLATHHGMEQTIQKIWEENFEPTPHECEFIFLEAYEHYQPDDTVYHGLKFMCKHPWCNNIKERAGRLEDEVKLEADAERWEFLIKETELRKEASQ